MFGADWENLMGIIVKKNQKNLFQNTFLDELETDLNFAGINPRTVYFMNQLQKENKK